MQKNVILSRENFTKMQGGVSSIGKTLYWMAAALEVHRQEFSAEPELLAELNRGGIDLLTRMESIVKDVSEVVKALRSNVHGRHLLDQTEFEDLSQAERHRLAEINKRLDDIAKHIVSVREPVESSLEESLNDPANRLHDYELGFHLDFMRSQSDQGYVDGGDPTISSMELMKSNLERDAQWPDGYDETLPFAHGGIFHQLRLYGNPDRNCLDYRDILKVGLVWVDVTVTYQYLYDLANGRWIKTYDCDPWAAVYVPEST